jgi:hypothetical protein
MLTRIYLFFGVLLILGYAWMSLTGRELGSPEQQFVPSSVRQSPGGYRSFHFWHTGYSGGK